MMLTDLDALGNEVHRYGMSARRGSWEVSHVPVVSPGIVRDGTDPRNRASLFIPLFSVACADVSEVVRPIVLELARGKPIRRKRRTLTALNPLARNSHGVRERYQQ